MQQCRLSMMLSASLLMTLRQSLRPITKKPQIGSSVRQLHMMPRLSQIERAQAIGMVRAFQWQVVHHFRVSQAVDSQLLQVLSCFQDTVSTDDSFWARLAKCAWLMTSVNHIHQEYLRDHFASIHLACNIPMACFFSMFLFQCLKMLPGKEKL